MKTSQALRIVFLSIVFGCGGPAYSQSSTGSISGTVTDQNNAVVAGATVVGKNTETGFVQSAVTNASGLYRLTNLSSGRYEITIKAAGFRTIDWKGITLDVGQILTIPAVLELGAIGESVTIDENASMLNARTAEVSTAFDERRISELPISQNRSVYNVALSTPGVAQLTTGQANFARALSLSVNGGRVRSNNFKLDGQDMNDPTFTGAEVALNNPDAIQEVTIITNQFRAEYGHNAASIVNVVGKSGTNEYHGEKTLDSLRFGQLRAFRGQQQPIQEMPAEAVIDLLDACGLEHVDADAENHCRAPIISAFMSRTAFSSPTKIARPMMQCPMLSSTISGIAATGVTLL